jgi:hypothetical protein
MKEYERHIIRTKGTAWCEDRLSSFDWYFQSIDHAVLEMESGSLLPCKKCLTAASLEVNEKLSQL